MILGRFAALLIASFSILHVLARPVPFDVGDLVSSALEKREVLLSEPVQEYHRRAPSEYESDLEARVPWKPTVPKFLKRKTPEQRREANNKRLDKKIAKTQKKLTRLHQERVAVPASQFKVVFEYSKTVPPGEDKKIIKEVQKYYEGTPALHRFDLAIVTLNEKTGTFTAKYQGVGKPSPFAHSTHNLKLLRERK
ncbi:hypothetical protein FA15DRAFT_671844 [Coprinopsis marcescibilis]|uniref:Uncharacterized protein n=1 Tax=Coprinopsis marcescibilis TaxID=230819 RepID=A0A5C3KQU8_COPMA|nr:hypothetical protein FA15DRAFT_671844 [Coprinopsis marcescibilis]